MNTESNNASDVEALKKYTRLADYLSVAQIFLRDNFLLEKELKPEHIKQRLLGHWGTSPGINFVYGNINRLIKNNEEKEFLYIVGPGHGFPAFQAGLFIEGSLTHYCPEKIPYTRKGLEEVTRNFSVPYGYPSHLNPEAPGVVLEGGELGYSLSNAYGTVLDNPNIVTVCLVGDGEAETGPLAASWNGNRLVNPKADGAVLPVLHLNGYKISGPTIFGRMSDEEITKFFEGHGYEPLFIDHNKEDELGDIYEQGALIFDKAMARITILQSLVRGQMVDAEAPKWPVIILRTPKGMGCPKEVDGEKIEGNHLSHQIVFGDVAKNTTHLEQLEEWLNSYNVDELVSFGEDGEIILDEDIVALLSDGARTLGRARIAHHGAQPILYPAVDDFLETATNRGEESDDAMRVAGRYLAKVFEENKQEPVVRLFSPDETYSNHLEAVFGTTARTWQWPIEEWDKDLKRSGQVVEILSEHTLFGMLAGYTLTGRHGFFVTYEAFAQIVASMADQYIKFVKIARDVHFRKPVPALNIVLSSLLERQDHNGFSHQNPSFIASMLDRDFDLVNVYFPADKNVMVHAMEGCLRSRDSLNIIACGKKMHRTWLTPEEAKRQVLDGVMIWDFLSDDKPDVVVATAGDYVTEEAVIGLKLFKTIEPDVNVRFVNFFKLDLLGEAAGNDSAKAAFDDLLTPDKGIVFNYHGYVATIKKLLFGIVDADRVIINGYEESGSTTSPFDMKARNGLSRFHLVKDIAVSAGFAGVLSQERVAEIVKDMDEKLEWEKEYIIKHKVDPHEITNWEFKN